MRTAHEFADRAAELAASASEPDLAVVPFALVSIALSLAKPAEALESDDFRDRHERAFRDHVLGIGADGLRDGRADSHVCDDLCSAAIIDRLIGRTPAHEYPLQPQHGATLDVWALREFLAELADWNGPDGSWTKRATAFLIVLASREPVTPSP